MRSFSPVLPPARRPTSVGAFNPASVSGLRSRLLDANTFTSPIDSKYYLKDSSTTNTHLPRQGRCWLFDGVNDYGVLPSGTNAVWGAGSFTFSCWIKGDGTAQQGILSINNSISTCLWLLASNAIMCGNAAGTRTTASNANTANTWTHLTLVYDTSLTGFDRWVLYVNGVSVSLTNAGVFTAPVAASENLGLVGTRNSGATFFPGSLRDIRIYSGAKTPTEITAIYNQSRTGSGTFDSAGLLAAYPCNEESGTTGYDISGNGNHLTLTNITQATFHATDTGVLANRNNAEGYRFAENLVPFSEAFDNAAWNKSQLTVTANATTDPLGGTNADFLAETASNAIHFAYQQPAITAGMTYTFSVYCKHAGRQWVMVYAGVPADKKAWFDVLNGVTGSKDSGIQTSIESAGNGWYRCSITLTSTASPATIYIQTATADSNSSAYLGDVTKGVYVWGAQLVEGQLSSYTPTTSIAFNKVYIPKRLSDSLAADGNALTVTGRAAYHGCAETPCFSGDGSTVYADLGSPLMPATGDYELSFWYYHTSAADERPFGQDSFIFYVNSQIVRARVFGTYNIVSGAILSNDTWNKITLNRTGDLHTMTVLTPTASYSYTYTGSGSNSVSANSLLLRGLSTTTAGRISDLRITKNGSTTYFPLQDGPGSSNTNRDIAWVKSDGTGGVISNAIVNGTVSTIWGNRVPGNVEDWCVKYGGRIAANGAFVAGMLTGGNAADGSAKTLAAGKFGNPFSRLNLNPATAAELNGRSVPTAAAAGADINTTITPTDSAFRRTASDGDDRILIYDDTLSGADLSNVEGYVA